MAADCKSALFGVRGFESLPIHHRYVEQLVVRWIVAPVPSGHAGSSPAVPTIKNGYELAILFIFIWWSRFLFVVLRS